MLNKNYFEEEETENNDVSIDDIDVSSLSANDKFELIKEIFDSEEEDENAMDLCKKVKKLCTDLEEEYGSDE